MPLVIMMFALSLFNINACSTVIADENLKDSAIQFLSNFYETRSEAIVNNSKVSIFMDNYSGESIKLKIIPVFNNSKGEEYTSIQLDYAHVKPRVESLVTEYINRQFERSWLEIKEVSFSQETFEVKDSLATITLLAREVDRVRLNSFGEHPAVRAYMKILEDQGDTLLQNEKNALNKELDDWKRLLTSYMNESSEGYIKFKVEVFKDGTYKLYAEVLGEEEYFAPVEEAFPVKTDKDIENETYESIKETLSHVKSHEVTSKELIPEYIGYDASRAVTYANKWTSNATTRCGPYSDDPFQNKTYYNPYYTAYTCTDCVNYVSQAVHEGSIPTDSTWCPYTSAWILTDNFQRYMLNMGYCWKATLESSAKIGAVCMVDQNKNSEPDHAMMVVYKNGSILKYSGHTSDYQNKILSITKPHWYLIFDDPI